MSKGKRDRNGEAYDSVWDALSDTPEEAKDMRLRSDLLMALQDRVEAWGVTQTEAAKRLGVTQPRVNDLLKGHIHKFSIDALVKLAGRSHIRLAVITDDEAEPEPA